MQQTHVAINDGQHIDDCSLNSPTSISGQGQDNNQLTIDKTDKTLFNSQRILLVTHDDLKRTFDVFLQVLLSQYLNSDFLIKIKEIQDEYFKPSIDLIETILIEKYDLVLNNLNEFLIGFTNKTKNIHLRVKPLYKYLLDRKPKLLVLDNYNIGDCSIKQKLCESLICEEDNNENNILIEKQASLI